ncbi:Release factor glutamine methyltransferase [Limihaloglobus sulfuriphilus]|uniref:Release factor glutamine methyltransferase n=1 Tax=Limihaloglobus sulfuriphilus TaxID=1851148 RepID=A0A1Q2MCF6_9BACT|nr:peptide chain release factor N(5)-glutamine methyltransferase [Limihaloglobus sulfuriphilus]AQQ70393.1 Release factor glutamine methyltransferase [Limihaloglobus sulfuriphilus]
MATWTTTRLLEWMEQYFTGKDVDSPRLTAEMLLSHVLNMKRIELYMHFEKPVPQDKLDTLRQMVKEVGEHKPVAYIVGYREFYSLRINVKPGCLIPRPETEMLVQHSIDLIRSKSITRVLDLCTGSGCIAAAIAHNCPEVELTASDISEKALETARENAENHSLKNITITKSDLFENIEGKFELIVSNPPYIKSSEIQRLDKNVAAHEPLEALNGGDDGLDVYRKIIKKLPDYLEKQGMVIFEIGFDQAEAVTKLLEEQAFIDVKSFKDTAGKWRMVTAVSPA